MAKIGLARLKKIIQEEMKILHEGEDHVTASKTAAAAAELLGAIEDFKIEASEKAKAELGTSLTTFETLLARIVGSPMQYVDATEQPSTVKKIAFKPVKSKLV